LHAHNRCDGDGGDGGEEKEDAGVALAMAVVAARQQQQQHRDAESFANAPSSYSLSSSTSFPSSSSSSFTAAPLLADAMLLAARLRSTCVSTSENTSMTTAARNDENTVSSSSSAPSLVAAALADPSVMVVSEVSSAVVLAQRDNQALLAGKALEEAKIQHAAHAAALSAEGDNPDFPPGFDPEDSTWDGVLRGCTIDSMLLPFSCCMIRPPRAQYIRYAAMTKLTRFSLSLILAHSPPRAYTPARRLQ
jgi:hypothetical protein